MAARRLVHALILLIVTLTVSCTGRGPGGSRPPDIILITIDTLRADHLGAYGYGRPTSPALDAFARESVVISDGIAQAPYTKASIASLLTGLPPSTHKTWSTSVALPVLMTGSIGERHVPVTDVLPHSVPVLPERLQQAGYETLAFTTNPFLIPDFGFARGFTRFRFFDGPTFASADAVLPEVLAAVRERHTTPVFVWVHLMEPHSPYAPPDDARDRLPPGGARHVIPDSVSIPPWLIARPSRDLRVYESLYDAEILTVDRALGRFFDGLRRAGVWETSAIIVTADHGEEFLDHGGLEHNRTLYDEMVHVPLMLKIPGVTPRRLEAQMELMDLFPTLVSLGGGRAPDAVFGADMLPLLRSGQGEDPYAVTELVDAAIAVRTREWKLIETVDGRRELYHLAADPQERRDVSTREPQRLEDLTAVLHGIRSRAASLARHVTPEAAPMRPSVLDRLRALGYIGPGGTIRDR